MTSSTQLSFRLFEASAVSFLNLYVVSKIIAADLSHACTGLKPSRFIFLLISALQIFIIFGRVNRNLNHHQPCQSPPHHNVVLTSYSSRLSSLCRTPQLYWGPNSRIVFVKHRCLRASACGNWSSKAADSMDESHFARVAASAQYDSS